MIRIVPTAPRKPTKASADASAKRRRDVNRAYGRCINHPLTDKAKPHGPPQPGSVRCALCAAVHQGRRIA